MRILRDRREVQYIILRTILTIVKKHPRIFQPYLSDFYIKASDPIFNRLLKLDILTLLCSTTSNSSNSSGGGGGGSNIYNILKELQIYMKHNNIKFVCHTIYAIGRICDYDSRHNSDPNVSNNITSKISIMCIQGLFNMVLYTKSEEIQQACIITLRYIIQQYYCHTANNTTTATTKSNNNNNNSNNEVVSKVIMQLIKLLIISMLHDISLQDNESAETQNNDEEGQTGEPSKNQHYGNLVIPVHSSLARSNIIWLISEYHSIISNTTNNTTTTNINTTNNITNIIPDIMRIFALRFIHEEYNTKIQILNCILKVSLYTNYEDNQHIQCIMTYILELSRYDNNTDLRDRSRALTALMGLVPSVEGATGEGEKGGGGSGSGGTQGGGGGGGQGEGPQGVDEEALRQLGVHTKAILINTKPPPIASLTTTTTTTGSAERFRFGSLSSMLGDTVPSHSSLPSWHTGVVDITLREPVKPATPGDSTESFSQWNAIKSGTSGGVGGSMGDGKVGRRHEKGFYDERSTSSSSSSEASDSDSDSEEEESSSGSDEDEESEEEESDEGSVASDEEEDSSESEEDEENEESDSSSDDSDVPPPPRQATTASVVANNQSQARGPIRRLQPTTAPSKQTKQAISTSPLDIFSGPVTDVLIPMSQPSPTSPLIAQDLLTVGHTLSTTHHAHHTHTHMHTLHSPSPLPLQQPQQIPPQSLSSIQTIQAYTPATYNPQQPTQPLSTSSRMMITTSNPPLSSAYSTNNTLYPNTNPPMYNTAPPPTLPPTPSPLFTPPDEEILSEPKIILKPDLTGGLTISLIYRLYTQSTSYIGAHCIYLIIHNQSDRPFRRVRVSFPVDIRATKVEEVAVLLPLQQVVVPVELVLNTYVGKSVDF